MGWKALEPGRFYPEPGIPSAISLPRQNSGPKTIESGDQPAKAGSTPPQSLPYDSEWRGQPVENDLPNGSPPGHSPARQVSNLPYGLSVLEKLRCCLKSAYTLDYLKRGVALNLLS